jgi:hypothetical protein
MAFILRSEDSLTAMGYALATVLPDRDKRVRAEALREAADEIEFLQVPPREYAGDESVGLLRAANVCRARAAAEALP